MSLELLTNLGFTDSAECLLGPGNKLQISIRANASCSNVLYAFVIDEEYVVYIGKSVNTLQNRLRGYAKPGAGQRTNIKVNGKVIAALNSGKEVRIYSFSGGDLLQYGGIGINLAAGLEDNLIRIVAEYNRTQNLPLLWNDRGNPHVGLTFIPNVQAEISREEVIEDNIDYENNEMVRVADGYPVTFTYTLVPSYWKNNWFNTGVGPSDYLGTDRSPLQVHLIDANGGEQLLTGMINRTAQSNGAPRIMLDNQYHSWIRANFNEGDVVRYEILNPNEIRILAE